MTDDDHPQTQARRGPSAEAPAAERPDARKARLAAELRRNLAQRKAQARARRSGAPDTRPDGLGPEAAEAGGAVRSSGEAED